jgi:hypothetical protein
MQVRRWMAVLAASVGGAGLTLVSTSGAPALGAAREPAAVSRHELIYVANADSGPVTVYNARSKGVVVPAARVNNPNNPNTFWDPWGVAFDKPGHLYVQTFLSDATTFVFPPGAHGKTPPSRIFQAQGPDNQSIAVDAKGYEYIAGGEALEDLAVVRPGAAGRPGDLYAVDDLRTIPLDEGFNPWPSILAVNTKNQVLVAVARPQGNAIEIFAGGAKGSTKPVRVIAGPKTDLGSCSAQCDEVSIAFSPLTGRIYAAVSGGAEKTHISVFAGNAKGDARPVRTIEGRATGLTGRVITGIADSQRDGTIYVMVKSSQFGQGKISAYDRTASGDAAPMWSFTDRKSGFADGAGIAIRLGAAQSGA